MTTGPLADALRRVLALHHLTTVTLHVDSDCTTGACDHDGITECPTYAARVCAHCRTLGDSQSEWETFLNEQAMFPCPTARAVNEVVSEVVACTCPASWTSHGMQCPQYAGAGLEVRGGGDVVLTLAGALQEWGARQIPNDGESVMA